MYDSWDHESGELWNDSNLSQRWEEPIEIQVNVVIKPIMNNDIPFTIVWSKLARVPPICIECSIREAGNFRPKIKPAVQKSKESYYKEHHRGKHEVYDGWT